MKTLAREVIVQRTYFEAALTDILQRLEAEIYDQSVTLAEAALGEHDSNYLALRHNIEAALKQALVEDDCDPTDELIDLCDK